jgi:hypothetical protein
MRTLQSYALVHRQDRSRPEVFSPIAHWSWALSPPAPGHAAWASRMAGGGALETRGRGWRLRGCRPADQGELVVADVPMVVYTGQTCEHVSQDFDLVPVASQDRGFSLGTWPVSGASANTDEAAPSLDT